MTILLNQQRLCRRRDDPKKYTCDGEDVSPPLNWSGVPTGTGSLLSIADDPDAPRGTWVHWVLVDLPPDLQGLPEERGGRASKGRTISGGKATAVRVPAGAAITAIISSCMP